MPEEITYYSDDRVQVTSVTAVFGDKTYAMANITSVSTTRKAANRTLGMVIMVVGFVITAMGLTGDISIPGTILGLLVLASGFLAIRVPKDNYRVTFRSASGETVALVSPNREYVEGIVAAVTEAIIQRG